MINAVGIHVFAGGFSYGVNKVHEVVKQLETHNFGLDTARSTFGLDVVNTESWEDWPDVKASYCFGNPRCTGFSCITAGYGEDTHGPWAKQTKDIHDLCHYGIKQQYDCIIWESVQQAFSIGRPLLDYLRDELFVPNGYRIAHLMLNAASFGNPQRRKRYFFVAYRDNLRFNICPPEIPRYHPMAFTALWRHRERDTHEVKLVMKGAEYDRDSYAYLTPDEKHVLPNLPNGFALNKFAPYGYEYLSEKQKRVWKYRTSKMPFSMHCITRLNYFTQFPTIHSSACRFIHPEFHRPCTVGEIADAMGWEGHIPQGWNPVAQIAKGVCPEVGTWLAEQVHHCLEGNWGNDDFESSYCDKTGEWVGESNTHNKVEKVFNLTKYVSGQWPEGDEVDEFPIRYGMQHHRFNICGDTGSLIRPWSKVEQSYRAHGGEPGGFRYLDESRAERSEEPAA